MKKLVVIALMLSLVGCSKKEEQPLQTYESIEAIQPTETQPIETSEIKETVEALVIEKTQFETAPMDSIEVIGVDENGNMQYIYNDVKVSDNASDNEATNTNSEQDYDDMASKKYLVTENDEGITVSEVEETESQESLLVPAEFDAENTLSDEEVYKLESEMIKNIDENTMKEAKESLRRALKDSVRILVDEGHSEFESFTDEVIDGMSEEEIIELNGKVDKAIRGY